MSDTKTGLMYSELTQKVYWGTMNSKTGIARSGKKDVTSDFIGIMLQKFPINTMQSIVCNGKHEATIIVLDEEKSHKYIAAKEMHDLLDDLLRNYELGDDIDNKITIVLSKVSGEQ